MLDLYNFKNVNDTHGHLTGDAVLAEVAGRIVSVVRSYDAVGRYGGEEFLIVLPDCNAGILDSVAERIRERIAAKPVITVDGDIDMTASIGGMIVDPGLTMEAETAIHRADVALYRAKNLGRNCCVFETSSIRP
jgi:diguanylate cyclase (GGDEF)-like protein